MTKPTVMVSSTFYDRRQIRADLATFIADELGYRPLLSELPTFPVDPDQDTIENCRRRVQNEADILVLVVGGRYGSVPDDEEKSVTNLEYLTARRVGVPVYAFVKSDVLSIMPVWEDNPDGDYSNVVDTPRLFSFVEQIRNTDKVWTNRFETAQDIIRALRNQFSYLFHESLKTRRKLASGGLPTYAEELSPDALRIALEKPDVWEYKLFCQVWIDEVAKRGDLLREYRSGLTVGTAEPVPAVQAPDWLNTRMHELRGLVSSAGQLLNVDAQEAFGKPGEPGEAESIVWVASRFGRVLEEIWNWVQRIRRAKVEGPFDQVAKEALRFPDDTIGKLEDFPVQVLSKIETALASATPENPQTVNMTLTFKLSNLEGFNESMERAEKTFVRSSTTGSS